MKNIVVNLAEMAQRPQGGECADNVLRELKNARTSPRTYSTYHLVRGNEGFVFRTTSKDVHLGLGLLSREAQMELVAVFQQIFKEKNAGVFIVDFESDEGGQPILQITCIQHTPKLWVYYLEPVQKPRKKQ